MFSFFFFSKADAGCQFSSNSSKAVGKPSYRGVHQGTFACNSTQINKQYNVNIISSYRGDVENGFLVHSNGKTVRGATIWVYVDVTNHDSRPIVLILASYEPVGWQLTIDDPLDVIERLIVVSA